MSEKTRTNQPSGGAPTAMSSEIREIPQVVRRIVEHEADKFDAVAAAVRSAPRRFAVIAARGTSDHAATYGQYLLEAELGLPTALATASLTTIYHRSLDWSDVLMIGLSQSGAGPDVVAVTGAARAGGATTVAITNEPDSLLAGAAEFLLDCKAGPERAVAATKTYVAELAALAALVARLSNDPRLLPELGRLPSVLVDVVRIAEAWVAGAEPLVQSLAASDRMLVVSRGFNLPTALEVALKFKETSGIFAQGYSSADLMHGPVALAQPGVPTLVFRPDGPMGAAIDGVIDRITAGGSEAWLIGGAEVLSTRANVRDVLALPVGLPEVLTPLAFVVAGFVLAETVARRRGMDPDTPKGLTKITRTV
ncbi:MAG TPA: SIS domain-containing protein [Coriobacteriia bacterium]